MAVCLCVCVLRRTRAAEMPAFTRADTEMFTWCSSNYILIQSLNQMHLLTSLGVQYGKNTCRLINLGGDRDSPAVMSGPWMLFFSSSLFQLLPGTQCTPGPERNASRILNCSWLSWKVNSWWMSSSPDSGGGSCPTVWTSATNKSRSGSRTAEWRRRD